MVENISIAKWQLNNASYLLGRVSERQPPPSFYMYNAITQITKCQHETSGVSHRFDEGLGGE